MRVWRVSWAACGGEQHEGLAARLDGTRLAVVLPVEAEGTDAQDTSVFDVYLHTVGVNAVAQKGQRFDHGLQRTPTSEVVKLLTTTKNSRIRRDG